MTKLDVAIKDVRTDVESAEALQDVTATVTTKHARMMLDELDRLRAVEAVKVDAVESVLAKHAAALGVVGPMPKTSANLLRLAIEPGIVRAVTPLEQTGTSEEARALAALNVSREAIGHRPVADWGIVSSDATRAAWLAVVRTVDASNPAVQDLRDELASVKAAHAEAERLLTEARADVERARDERDDIAGALQEAERRENEARTDREMMREQHALQMAAIKASVETFRSTVEAIVNRDRALAGVPAQEPRPNPLLVPLSWYADGLEAVAGQSGCSMATADKLCGAVRLIRLAINGGPMTESRPTLADEDAALAQEAREAHAVLDVAKIPRVDNGGEPRSLASRIVVATANRPSAPLTEEQARVQTAIDRKIEAWTRYLDLSEKQFASGTVADAREVLIAKRAAQDTAKDIEDAVYHLANMRRVSRGEHAPEQPAPADRDVCPSCSQILGSPSPCSITHDFGPGAYDAGPHARMEVLERRLDRYDADVRDVMRRLQALEHAEVEKSHVDARRPRIGAPQWNSDLGMWFAFDDRGQEAVRAYRAARNGWEGLVVRPLQEPLTIAAPDLEQALARAQTELGTWADVVSEAPRHIVASVGDVEGVAALAGLDAPKPSKAHCRACEIAGKAAEQRARLHDGDPAKAAGPWTEVAPARWERLDANNLRVGSVWVDGPREARWSAWSGPGRSDWLVEGDPCWPEAAFKGCDAALQARGWTLTGGIPDALTAKAREAAEYDDALDVLPPRRPVEP